MDNQLTYWNTGVLYVNWTAGAVEIRWNVANSTLEVNHLGTEYVLIPVAASKSGAAYNPTADTVQFAFMPNSVQVPVTADWVTGSWETVPTNIIYPYNARCLVGPSGSTALTLGTYVMYVKITDNPEIPVIPAGQLVIT